ncbi:MAG: glycosyltransferase [candidate division WOR-3 bacterium]|nr:MAG: glycosyltransferase [candidate division WOR-3 bacterium]
MNIVLVGPTYPFKGGIAHYSTLLCLQLRKKHRVKFLTFSRQYPALLYPGDPGCDKSRIKLSIDDALPIIDWANPVSWVKAARVITDFSPVIVIFAWWMWGWVVPFWIIAQLSRIRSGAKILYICHNVIEHEPNFWRNFLSKFALTSGDFYIAHSQDDYDRLKQLFPHAVIKLNFHPTYKFFNRERIKRGEARQRLGIEPEFKKVLLFFGIVRPYKGLRYLIEAMPRVIKEIPDLCLVIAGEFWQEKDLIVDMIHRFDVADHVLILDEYIPNEDVFLYFSACDVVVLPYVTATGSGVTQIAFGFNKPVVATATGDLPYVVENGRRGLIVPPEDSTLLADAIIRCFDNDLLRTFRKNISKDGHLFSWENLTNSIEQDFVRA